MNEVDWLRGTDLRAMVLHVADRASLRKARLFAAACCRRVWPAFQDRRGRDAVEGAERLADGLAGAADQAEASDGALAAVDEVARQDPEFFTRADHFAN